MAKGRVDNMSSKTEAIPNFFGKDMKEAIILQDGQYCLVEMVTKKITPLSNNIESTRELLKTMGKIDNFSDF